MRKVKALFFILLFFSATAGLTASEDQLWQKSLALFSRNSLWYPKMMLVRTKEYDDAGELTSMTFTEIEFSIDKEGELESEVLKAIKDGKDITAKQKRARRREKNPFLISPFNPEHQDSVTVIPKEDTKKIGTALCVKYELSVTYEKELYSGTAWLEMTTGAPLLLFLRMETLPRYLDSFTMTFHYFFQDAQTWYTSKIEMEGSGTFLFQKKTFHSETILEDHFQYTRPEVSR